MTNFQIVREGFAFRAVNAATGYRSQMFTSASQAGYHIEGLVSRAEGRKAGKAAHLAVYKAFCSNAA